MKLTTDTSRLNHVSIRRIYIDGEMVAKICTDDGRLNKELRQ